MRVGSAMIGMESARRYSSVQNTVSFIGVTREQTRITAKPQPEENKTAADKDENYKSLKDSMEEFRQKLNAASINRVSVREQSETLNSIRQGCLRYLLKLFMGDSLQNYSLSESVGENAALQGSVQSVSSEEMLHSLTVTTKTYSMNTKSYYSESEQTSFSTTGKVITADGREIEFGLEMEMSRSFQTYYEANYDVMKVEVCDPLVINLDSNIAELSDQKFFFDLDADGEMDSISMLGGGSGYLALDKNGDGIINDGNELFGTKSGDGFKDLTAYDEDGNGWIDEADSIYSQLKIWSKDENGKDILYTLAEKGVGAICLANAKTDFALTNEQDNSVNGYIRSTGVYLREDGTAGTVQHLDLAK